MCLIQELCLYIYNFKKYAKKSKGLLPLLYTNVVLSFAMLLQFRETDPRVHEVTPELHPAPQFWATTSLHINSAILNRPKTTVFSLSLSQHSFSHSIIISLPNRFPGKGLLNTANSQSNALLAPWTETTTNCANGHSMGDKRAYPPPPHPFYTHLPSEIQKATFPWPIIFLHIMSLCLLQQNAFNAGVITMTSQQNFAAQDWGTPGNRREGANSICHSKNISFTWKLKWRLNRAWKWRKYAHLSICRLHLVVVPPIFTQKKYLSASDWNSSSGCIHVGFLFTRQKNVASSFDPLLHSPSLFMTSLLLGTKGQRLRLFSWLSCWVFNKWDRKLYKNKTRFFPSFHYISWSCFTATPLEKSLSSLRGIVCPKRDSS